MYIYIYIYIRISIVVYVYMYMYLYIYICMCVTYVYIYICTYIFLIYIYISQSRLFLVGMSTSPGRLFLVGMQVGIAMCTYMYVHLQNVCVCIIAWVHVWMNSCIYGCICMHGCVDPSMHACMCTCVYVCMCACMYVCVFLGRSSWSPARRPLTRWSFSASATSIMSHRMRTWTTSRLSSTKWSGLIFWSRAWTSSCGCRSPEGDHSLIVDLFA